MAGGQEMCRDQKEEQGGREQQWERGTASTTVTGRRQIIGLK